MKKLTILVLVLVTAFSLQIALAQAPITTSKPTVESVIKSYAALYGVSSEKMMNTLKCESGLDPTKIGDNGTSYGIAQIHLVAHPDVTKEQALDRDFSIEWMAQKFKDGQAHIWTCYRLLYK